MPPRSPLQHLTLGWLTLLVAGPAAAQLVNSGFEAGTLSPWEARISAESSDAFATNLQAHSGQYSGLLYDNQAQGHLAQSIPTTPGTTYVISAWVFNNDISGTQTNQAWLGSDGSPPVSCAATVQTWVRCEATFTASANSSEVRLYAQTRQGYGSMYFDDVTLTASPSVSTPLPVPALSDSALGLLIAMAAGLGLGAKRMRCGRAG